MKHGSMRIGSCLMLCIATASVGTPSADAQSTPSPLVVLQQDMDSLKQDMAEIKKALSELRLLITQRPAVPAQAAAPAVTRLSVGKGPSLGKPDAPVTVVEFSDYQCPFCQRHFTSALAELKRDYIDTGKVRYVFRDFPLDVIHPQARKAAEAAHCAGEQGKYWEMHDTLFRNQGTLRSDNLKHFARTMGLKEDEFNTCLDQDKYANTISEDQAAGSALGVTGTPSFFIARTTADGTLEATGLRGAQPAASFRQVIDGLLESKP